MSSSIPPEIQRLYQALEAAYLAAQAYQKNPGSQTWQTLHATVEQLHEFLNTFAWPSPPTTAPLSAQILIVEDEPDTADMLGEMLSLRGHQVKKLYRAQAAIEYLNQHQPHIVLLDIMMPGTSGLEVLRYIRQTPHLQHIPVVVVSAKSLPSDIQEALAAGAQAYLVKPVTFSDLAETVENLLRSAS